MDDTVFDLFPDGIEEYTFLKIKSGTMVGDVIESTHISEGILKIRSGMAKSQNQETREANDTLHIYPEEPFIPAVIAKLVGHGIRSHGSDFRIEGATRGKNYDTGETEHYTLTLSNADFTSLPQIGG